MVRMDDTKSKKKKGLDEEDELADPAVLDTATEEGATEEDGEEWVDGKADAEEEY